MFQHWQVLIATSNEHDQVRNKTFHIYLKGLEDDLLLIA